MNEWEFRLLEDHRPLESFLSSTGELRPGTRVRLRPRASGGDAMDTILAGRLAVIESLEQDYEGRVHVALVFDDDPGRDLGMMRQPGHRFFYSPDEVECVSEEDSPGLTAARKAPTGDEPILIAGIGNIFLGDDGFGVEVAQRLLAANLPAGVRVVDFGIRSLDLAYALMESTGVTILVDACSRGQAPGTLFVIEPEDDENVPLLAVEAHAMHPLLVMRMAKSMGGSLNRILLVGCEPATFGAEEGHLGLSDPVTAAVDGAVDLALTLVQRIREGIWPGQDARSGFETA
jgi:hydrogenase maturation protease